MMKRDYKYNEGDVLQRNNGQIQIVSKTRIPKKSYLGPHDGSRGEKGYNIKCLICDSIFDMPESYLNRGNGCPICSGHRVQVGKNDLWTTNPNIAEMLTNSEDGYKYTINSNKKIGFTCPICKTDLGIHSIYDVNKRGISCKSCGDGISYPNKFMFNLLEYLGEDFETEYGYEWCKYPAMNDPSITKHGRYDFYLKSRYILVEMDSGLGHGQNVYTNGLVSAEETAYSDVMKDIVATQLGYEIIRIDCSYFGNKNRFDACKEGILNSRLSTILCLDNIPWETIGQKCLDSYIVKACNLYNQGYTTAQISQILKKDFSTVCDYLHDGESVGLCVFIKNRDVKNRRRRVTPLLHQESGMVFDSILTLSKLSLDIIGFNISKKALCNTIQDNTYIYKNNHFIRITRKEFDDYKSKYPDKAFGDYFYKEEKEEPNGSLLIA